MFYPFGGLWSLASLILLIVAFVKISNLKSRVSQLESKSLPNTNPAPANIPNAPVSATGPSSAAPIPVSNIPPHSDSGDKFIKWLKDDWLLKLGGLLLLIGFGWFTTYAFANNWIGPTGRIMLGIGAGILILGLGTFRIKKYINQGGIFLVLGSTIIMLTIFAAREVYDMFNPLTALALIFLSTAYIALISVKYNSFAVSFSGLVLAAIAPLLVNEFNQNEVALFTYLLVVVLGALWIVALRKNWGALIFGSVIMVFLHSLPMIFDSSDQVGKTLLNFAYVFALIFFISSIVSILKSKEGDIKAFLWVAVVNGIFLLTWINAFAPDEWKSSIIAVWMLIFAIGAFMLFAQTKIRSVFYVYGLVSIAMLVAATAVELDGAALTLAYTIESAIIPLLIYFVARDLRASSVSTFLMIGPILLSAASLDDYSRSREVLTQDFFVLALLAVVLIVVGSVFKKIKHQIADTNFKADNVLLIIGSIYVYVLVWTSLHIAMVEDYAVATTISLIIFTIIGLVKYFYGISIGSKILRNYGGIFLGLVVLRLLFIDVWNMEMGVRIVVFFLVGLLLVSTAFISRKIKNDKVVEIQN